MGLDWGGGGGLTFILRVEVGGLEGFCEASEVVRVCDG